MERMTKKPRTAYPQPRSGRWVCSDGTEFTDRAMACRYEAHLLKKDTKKKKE